jgi:hypothetical protein
VHHDLCDSYEKKYRKSEVHTNRDAVAAKLESLHVHEVWTRRAIECWYSKQWFILPHSKISVWRTENKFIQLMHINKYISTWLVHDIPSAEHVDVFLLLSPDDVRVCGHH